MRVCLVLATLALLLPLAAITLHIQVTDDTATPLPDVAISDGHALAYTDAAGYASIATTADSLLFRRLGYATRVLPVAGLPAVVVLPRAPEPLPGLHVQSARPAGVIDVPPGRQGDVAMLLRQQSDVFVASSPLPGTPQQASLQGGRARHVRVELDGVLLNRAGQAFDLSSIPASAIERVEIVRGPVPGAGGMDGAIRLWSRKASTSLCEATGTTGAFGLHGWRHALHLADTNLACQIESHHQSTDGDFAYTDPFSGQDAHRANNASREDDTRVRLDWRETAEAEFTARRFVRGLPGPVNQKMLYDAARMQGEVTRLRVRLSRSGFALHLMQEQERTHFRNIGSTSPFYAADGVTRSTLRQALLHGERAWGVWRAGGDVELRRESFAHDDRLNPTASIAQETQDNIGAEAALRWRTAGAGLLWTALAEARADWQRAAPDASGRLELTCAASHGLPWQLTLGAGHSFTLPSFYDLYWRGDSQAMGNPDLKPETSDGLQAELRLGGGDWELAGSADWRWYSDLIHWHRSVLGWKPENLSAAEKRVFGVTGRWDVWPILRLDASYQRIFAWDRSLDDSSAHSDHWGCHLTNTPTSRTRLGLVLSPGCWQVAAGWARTGRRWPTQDNQWGALPPYELVNASIAWEPEWAGLRWSFKLEGDNLLDKRYVIYTAEPMPGLQWQATAGFRIEL